MEGKNTMHNDGQGKDWVWFSVPKDRVEEKASKAGKEYFKVHLPNGTELSGSGINLSGATLTSFIIRPHRDDSDLLRVCVRAGAVKVYVPTLQEEKYLDARSVAIAVAVARRGGTTAMEESPKAARQERLKIVVRDGEMGADVKDTNIAFTDRNGKESRKKSVTLPEGTLVDGRDCSGMNFIVNYADRQGDSNEYAISLLAGRQVTLSKASFDAQGNFDGYDKFITSTDSLHEAVMGLHEPEPDAGLDDPSPEASLQEAYEAPEALGPSAEDVLFSEPFAPTADYQSHAQPSYGAYGDPR